MTTQTVLGDAGGTPAASGQLLTADGAGASAWLTPTGWIDDTSETWTYASGSGGGTATFTVSGDVTAKYTVGTRIKLTQSTAKYFVVSADPVFSGGNTTVTVTAGSDYTLANAAISGNYHSYAENPQGYPGWFNASPASTGFSSKTVDALRFSVSGRTCFCDYVCSGTSNATTYTFTVPVTISSNQVTDPQIVVVRVTDNGVGTAVGALRLGLGTSTVTVGKVLNNSGGFTSSGTKGALGYFNYEV